MMMIKEERMVIKRERIESVKEKGRRSWRRSFMEEEKGMMMIESVLCVLFLYKRSKRRKTNK